MFEQFCLDIKCPAKRVFTVLHSNLSANPFDKQAPSSYLSFFFPFLLRTLSLSLYLSLSLISFPFFLFPAPFVCLPQSFPLVHLHFHSVSLLTLLFLLSYSPSTNTPLFAPPHPPLHLLQFAALVFHFYCFAVQLILFDSKARSKREEKRYCLWIFSDILNRLRLFPSLSPSLSLCVFISSLLLLFFGYSSAIESRAHPRAINCLWQLFPISLSPSLPALHSTPTSPTN